MKRVSKVSLALLVATTLAIGCKKSQEPERSASFQPSMGSSSSAAPARSAMPLQDAAPDADALTPAEKRGVYLRIDNTQCEAAAKHANQVNGRPETDPKGVDLLSGCLRRGNVAWHACVMAAKTGDAVMRCNIRLLLTADELPPR